MFISLVTEKAKLCRSISMTLFLNQKIFEQVRRQNIKYLVILLDICLFFLTSCGSPKNAVYFDNISDTLLRSLTADVEPVIQKNDLLSISVSSLNPEATIIFNMPNIATVSPSVSTASSAMPAGAGPQITGYLVNREGTIQFPVLGYITAAGLSKKQFSDDIGKRLVEKKLLVDPIVNVRFLNFKVTVLGEVAKPSVITVPNEKISVLEALGMAGDLTIYAKRDNVLLIREEGNGEKLIRRINLNSSNVLNSPYYYLKTNDVIYAEPNKNKLNASSTSRQVLPIVLSGLSFIAIIVTQLLRK